MAVTYTRATPAEKSKYGVEWRVRGSAWRRQPFVGRHKLPGPYSWRSEVAARKAAHTRALAAPGRIPLHGDGPETRYLTAPSAYGPKGDDLRIALIDARYRDWLAERGRNTLRRAA